MTLDPLSLECFLAVAESGSFTKAASSVKRSQSAISQHITKLESQMGELLFERGKKLKMTPHGELLLSYAKKIVELSREAIDRFKYPKLIGEVRFGLPEDFATLFLSELLSEYSSLHPQVSLHVECDLTIRLFSRFKQKEFDLVLVKMNKPEEFECGTAVWSEPLVWVGKHEFFKRGPLEVLPLVVAPEPCVYRKRAITALSQAGRRWRITFSSHNFAATTAAVQAGMGVTVLPRNRVPRGFSSAIPSDEMPKLEDAHLTLLKHPQDHAAIHDFEEFILRKLC